ncbi:arginase family protein [Microbacterium saperdae]
MSAPVDPHAVTVIGLPYHFGAPPRPTGYQMARGPHVLLADDAAPALLKERFADVEKIWIDDADEPDERDYGDDIRLFPPGDQMIRQLIQCRRLASAVDDAISNGRFPVVAAGNCHTTIGVIGGIDDPEIGLIWFDAHSDAGSPDTSSNGMFEGMPVSAIAGKCWPRYVANVPGFHVIPEDRMITVGDHEIHSPNGRDRVGGSTALGRVVSPPEIAAAGGFTAAMSAAVEDLASRVTKVHVHIDTDVVDNAIAWGNGHASDGGLAPEEVVEAISLIAARLEIAAVNFAAYDPTVDPESPKTYIPLVADVVSAALTTRRHAVSD